MSLIGRTVGNYKIVAKIGEGGMGSVYLGEHPLIGKRVAIKVLHDELASRENIVSRFFTEAKAVNDIGHPNIVDIVDFGRLRDSGVDTIYLVMEFLDGEGLNLRLKREGITIEDAVYVAEQCASALQASHDKNIIHRDLKPENIYLVKRGTDRNYVKLLDFGIAKLTGADGGVQSLHQTRTGLVIGTPSYMSPEQCDGRGDIDWRSDIYSLGIVLFEMLTGQVLFPGSGFGEIVVAHMTKPAPLPSSIRTGIPRSLEAIVLRAVEKRREDRFQSMDELRHALEDPEVHLNLYHGADAAWQAQDEGLPLPGVVAGMAPTMMTQGTRPTTLSGATGEVALGSSVARSHASLFAGLGAAVAAVALGVFFLVESQRDKTPIVMVQPAPMAASEDTRILIDSSPRGAQVFRAGHADAIGKTPFQLKVKRQAAEFDVVVRLAGYRDEVKRITTQRDHDLLIPLAATATVTPMETTPTIKGKGPTRPKKARKKEPIVGGGDDVLEPTF